MCRACFSPLILRDEFFPTKNTSAFGSESLQPSRRNFMAASVATAVVAGGRIGTATAAGLGAEVIFMGGKIIPLAGAAPVQRPPPAAHLGSSAAR